MELVGSIGAEVIDVTGPVISINQLYSEGVGSMFPARSCALVENVWLPSVNSM